MTIQTAEELWAAFTASPLALSIAGSLVAACLVAAARAFSAPKRHALEDPRAKRDRDERPSAAAKAEPRARRRALKVLPEPRVAKMDRTRLPDPGRQGVTRERVRDFGRPEVIEVFSAPVMEPRNYPYWCESCHRTTWYAPGDYVDPCCPGAEVGPGDPGSLWWKALWDMGVREGEKKGRPRVPKDLMSPETATEAAIKALSNHASVPALDAIRPNWRIVIAKGIHKVVSR